MPNITLTTKFTHNDELVISPKEIKDNYLFGVKIKAQNGVEFSDEEIKFYILAAQKEVEEQLGVKLIKQIYKETVNFKNDDWWHWGFIKTTYPVSCVLQMDGYLNTVKQVQYPLEWVSTKKVSDGELYHRSIYLVPTGNSSTLTNNAVYSGIIPQLQYYNQSSIPNYWNLVYTTGFETIPSDILNVIGRIAAINLFHIAGDLILGTAGISSQSLGIDGLSQSINTTASATSAGYGARIMGYVNDIKDKLPTLIEYYRGINWTVC